MTRKYLSRDHLVASQTTKGTHAMVVSVSTKFDTYTEQADGSVYLFTYTVSITNQGDTPATLVSRHWHITDANARRQEVQGPGVLGKQPLIPPGQTYQYTSHVPLPTPVGSMQGTYHFISVTGVNFTADIPPFSLAKPDMVH